MKLTTYLNFGGNCAEAFKYYERHLGAKIGFMMTFDQSPEATAAHPGIENGILHGVIEIAGVTVMASDVPRELFQPMRSGYLALNVDSDAEAERIYNELADGGEVFMALGETFFASKFAQLRDRFGINWMVIHEKPMPAR